MKGSNVIIISTPASDVPGDTSRVMDCPHTDSSDRAWPAGTEFRPLSRGYDNERGHDVQVVSIAGEQVTFGRP